MDIIELTKNPSFVFKESFDYSEGPVASKWENKLSEILNFCSNNKFNSGTELLEILEKTTKASFSSCDEHSITNLNIENSKCSELLGSVLMSLLWLNNHQTFPKIMNLGAKYFFVTPSGEINQVNTNRKAELSNSEKYDLISSEESNQLSFVDLIKHYFEELCAGYIRDEKFNALKKAQSYMIEFDPKDIKWYARRGLLFKRLGEFSESLSDLKRFLSFCSYEDAPAAVKSALIELEGLKATDNFSDYSIH